MELTVSKSLATIRDLGELNIISDPQISPDGDKVAFVYTTLDFEEDEYKNNIWLTDLISGETRQFTRGRDKNKNPRWSPDGASLLFTSRPPGEEDGENEKPQIFIISLDGGEAKQITDLKNGVEAPRWSPDGEHILFIGWSGEEPEDDVKVIKRISYRYNGKGFYKGRRKHIFTVPMNGGDPVQVTAGEFDVAAAEWLRDGDYIVFISNREKDADFTRRNYIYRVPSRGSKPVKILKEERSISSIAPSPTTDEIAYIGHDFSRGLATNQNLWIISSKGGDSRNLTDLFDQDIGTKLSCDVRVNTPNPNPCWDYQGENLYFTSTYEGIASLHKISSKDGSVKRIIGRKNNSVEAFTLSKDEKIVYSALATTKPIELWMFDGKKSRQLINFNKEFRENTEIVNHKRFEFKSSAGHLVEGWIMKPPGFEEAKQYPLVFEIHGGPRGAYGYSMMHEFQVLAAQGWVVAYVNPYGSGGYYEDFQAGLPGRYGEQDYLDIMDAIDYLLETCEYINPEKLGVTGGSYGGFMTNWIVGHTDKFKAAVTQRSISNWISFFGCSDIGWTFGEWEIDGLPWKDVDKFWDKSPIKYAESVKTPTLIIHSEDDYRCPMEQAEQFFTALKHQGVPTELVRFPEENHDLSRSGKPKHREKRLELMIQWFKKYLCSS